MYSPKGNVLPHCVQRPRHPALGGIEDPGREVPHINDLGGVAGDGRDHGRGVVPGKPCRPVAVPVRSIAGAADQAGAAEVRPVAHSFQGCLFNR